MMDASGNLGEVLIVEDTPASLKLLSDLLARSGYAVRQAPDGELALWTAEARPPELILLDVRMPGIDGFEVCRRLKQSATLRDIPVIFLSAQSDTDDKVRGFQAGAIDFIGKPYQPEEVLARTSAHIALARSQRALAIANAELTLTLDQLNATRAELRRAERLAALGSMVAGIAHELNTPIGNCVLAATTLEQRSSAFARVAEEGLRRADLTAFIGDATHASELLMRNLKTSAELIDRFKQVATDQASVVRRPFELATLFEEVRITLAPRLAASAVTLTMSAKAPVHMDSYPAALGQVIIQLVSNALIHGFGPDQPGSVTVGADTDRGCLILVLHDDGKGIPAPDLNRVFDPFFTTRMNQGSGGLGLHIVHNLVTNVLGGTIEARSQAGDTCFILRCPCIAPALAHAGAAP